MSPSHDGVRARRFLYSYAAPRAVRFNRSIDVGPTDSPSFVVFAIVGRLLRTAVVTQSYYSLLFSGHDGPGLAGIFMCQCHTGNVKAAPLQQTAHPAALGILLIPKVLQGRTGAVYQ